MSRSAERSIIINADDLGLSSAVNDAIFSLMEDGLVTSATAMANGAAIDEAIDRAKAFPKCSFGVHLNITEGMPMRPSSGLAPILDSSGALTRQIFEISVDANLRDAVADEWCAQVESLLAKGLRVSHVDSHEHVHTIPGLFTALKAVQRKFGIRKARLTKNLYCRELGAASKALLFKKALWNAALRHSYRTRATKWFGDFYSLNRTVFEGVVGRGVIEAMVHPGASGNRIMETEIVELRNGALRQMPFPVRLISYHEL